MVKRYSPTGLIATTRADVTPPLDELVCCCRWPLLLAASPRRLACELSLHNPECVLFWLDERQGIAALARLVEWSRERSTRPYRVAVALDLDADVELQLRAAGAHSFLSVVALGVSRVVDALRPLLAEPQYASRPWTATLESTLALELSADPVHPP